KAAREVKQKPRFIKALRREVSRYRYRGRAPARRPCALGCSPAPAIPAECRQNSSLDSFRRRPNPRRRDMSMDTLEARSGEQLRQDYLDRARELQPMLRADSDEIERRREVTPEVV